VDKPGFLELQPAFGIEIVQFIGSHRLIVNRPSLIVNH
jgi:hypothetical protein